MPEHYPVSLNRAIIPSEISTNLIVESQYNLKFYVTIMAEKKESTSLTPSPSQEDQVQGSQRTHDAVFGEIREDGPNYRNVCSPAAFKHNAVY